MISFVVKKLIKYSFVVVILIVFFYYKTVITDRKKTSVGLSDFEIIKSLDIAKLENAKRLLHLERICKKYNLGKFKTNTKPVIFKEPPTPHYEIFFYNRQHKLSWCPIFKAGSSTWLYNFALLGGSTDEEINTSKLQINEFVRNIFPALSSDEAIAFLPNSLKFMIVRHPFERILSAYRDKLENIATSIKSGTKFYYRKFGRKIVSKYRNGGNNTNIRDILRQDQYNWKSYDNEPVGIEPTFKEFVKYLIETDLRMRADDHWIPFYLYCTPCSLKFNIIGKVETMLQDQLLIIYSSNLQQKLQPHWRHRTNPIDQTNNTTVSEIAKIYFSQLNETDVRELHKKYLLDFILFDYSETDYFKYVSK